MIERTVQLPVGREQVWEAITEPEAMAGWFGGTVEWEVRPGGAARFAGLDGAREGRVTAVEPGRRLRFVWWPAGEEAATTEVTYDLEEADDGTLLRVSERHVGAGHSPTACAGLNWSPLDAVLLGVWSRCGAGAPVAATGAGRSLAGGR